jgi:hypothetical protein
MDEFNNGSLGDMFNRLNDEEKEKLKNFLSKIKDFDPTKDDMDIIGELGEPDIIEEFEEDGMKFTRKIWEGDGYRHEIIESEGGFEGMDVEEIVDKFTYSNPFNKSQSLEERLEEAIENEEFEKAAELRDLISKKKEESDLFTDKNINVKPKGKE